MKNYQSKFLDVNDDFMPSETKPAVKLSKTGLVLSCAGQSTLFQTTLYHSTLCHYALHTNLPYTNLPYTYLLYTNLPYTNLPYIPV